MIVEGKYATAEIFAENIEEPALDWVQAQCDHKAFKRLPKHTHFITTRSFEAAYLPYSAKSARQNASNQYLLPVIINP